MLFAGFFTFFVIYLLTMLFAGFFAFFAPEPFEAFFAAFAGAVRLMTFFGLGTPLVGIGRSSLSSLIGAPVTGYLPPSVGSGGFPGLRLDAEVTVDWDVVEALGALAGAAGASKGGC